MINKSNDLPSFVNETNLPKIVDKLTDAKNIKISNNKYGNRVQTVVDKIVEKADDITKAIKQEVVNDSYSFKVGTGNVDVSTDVQDGFGEVGIKGVTYQNLVDVSKSYQNLSFVAIKDGSIEFLELGADTTRTIFNDMTLLKPNTKYTIITDCERMCTSNEQNMPIRMNNDGTSYNINVFGLNVEKVGITSMLFTTPSDVSNLKLLFYNNPRNAGFKFKYILILEGDHTNNPNLPSYFEGIVGVGDKSKNLFDIKKFKEGFAFDNNGNEVVNTSHTISDWIKVKKNTNYSINKLSWGRIYLFDENKNFINYYAVNSGSYTINTSNATYLRINTSKNSVEDIQLEEGSTVTPYEPYYEGHKIEILSRTKNIWNGIWLDEYVSTTNGTFSSSNTAFRSDYIAVDKDSDYYISIENPNEKILVAYYDINKNYLGRTGGTTWKSITLKRTNGSFPTETTTVMPPTTKYIVFSSYSHSTIENRDNSKFNMKIQIEQGGNPTSYVSPQQDKTQILLDEPLMRLPNGVCDEITRDRKLIRRVGKVVLNGSEDYIASSSSENTMYFVLKNLIAKKSGYCMSNNFYFEIGSNDNEHIRLNANGNIVFWIKTSKLASQDSAGVKQWLSQNPTTVYYELAEPIITELPAPYLRIFKDGHLTFNTLVAPESTHVVQLNKSGQIQNAIKESQSLDNRINVLENNYDNLILFTMSRLNDLELNYTLK